MELQRHDKFAEIAKRLAIAEAVADESPQIALQVVRTCLESLLRIHLKIPTNESVFLSDLVNRPEIKARLKGQLLDAVEILRAAGNAATHDLTEFTAEQARIAIRTYAKVQIELEGVTVAAPEFQLVPVKKALVPPQCLRLVFCRLGEQGSMN